MNNNMVEIGELAVNKQIHDFVNEHVLPHTGLQQATFWADVEQLFAKFIPTNQALLADRQNIQQQIDSYHLDLQANDKELEPKAYKQFLTDIDYLRPQPAPFAITSENVDTEISTTAGPQLVVPVKNARYALNAANARWGSLYDAFYGTDALSREGELAPTAGYNPVRGQAVIDKARGLLNQYLPIEGDWQQVTALRVQEQQLLIKTAASDAEVSLQNEQQFVGYQGAPESPTAVILKHNNLHWIIQIDATSQIGQHDPAHISDIVLESAVTTIMDCEDSVAAVDAEDKLEVYKNWLGLMTGELAATVTKGSQSTTRKLKSDLEYTTADGTAGRLPGRALMFVRNVGHLMTNPAITYSGNEAPEGIMDAVFTSLIGKIDLLKDSSAAIKNSQAGSIYIVKPKMHGPDEVKFSNELFNAVEDLIQVPRHSIKMGIMDEERRTSVNLRACIYEAKERVVFINTGFLDRTGDELHTSMKAGPFKPKGELKAMNWIAAYEKNNVASGLLSGFQGKAQIGKGMWPVPDQMAAMLETKQVHPEAGANTAWVPSPTAATLHALHYHQVAVANVQSGLLDSLASDVNESLLDEILDIPLLRKDEPLSPGVINHELDNNAQGILGYVVRWVDAGIGCSKVPDINNVGLMEDRATCRISSQHMANWLEHGLCSEDRVVVVMKKMAAVVDQQNEQTPGYEPMGPDFENSIAFNAALDLVLKGREQPNGYTEPLLHEARLAKKAKG